MALANRLGSSFLKKAAVISLDKLASIVMKHQIFPDLSSRIPFSKSEKFFLEIKKN